jgi:hypothetical protein
MIVSRRSFLSGLILAPAIIKYDSLMPVRLFLRDGQGAEGTLDQIWPVIDTRSGLVVRLSAKQIIEGGARYRVYFESVPDPSADMRAKSILAGTIQLIKPKGLILQGI